VFFGAMNSALVHDASSRSSSQSCTGAPETLAPGLRDVKQRSMARSHWLSHSSKRAVVVPRRLHQPIEEPPMQPPYYNTP
jgi:hypothetical protein